MKKELSDEDLIELAKLAKPVVSRIQVDNYKDFVKNSYSSVEEFLAVTGLKNGRNLISSSALYELYVSWAKVPVSRLKFGKDMNKYLRRSSVNYFKLNFKPITLMEIIKRNKENEKK